jgi:NADP-reducing hydrogenase subunit HndB
MAKLTIEDLKKIKEQTRRTTLLREGAGRAKVTVHMGTCGIAAGARNIMDALMVILEEQNADDVILTTSGCAGLCSREPMATIEIANEAPVKYVDLTPDKIRQVFTQHVMQGEILTDYALAVGSERTH